MTRIIVVITAVVACIGWSAASQAAPGIKDSAHDLSATESEICIVCHTPHNADVTIADAPLWNHTLTAAPYTLYASPTLTATDLAQPTGVSKLCLSCHDGTVAPDAFGGQAGTALKLTASTGGLGTNLKMSHPISFSYTAEIATTDGELADPATLPAGWVNGGKFECSSCHDVHNKAGFSSMLLKENTASALCLTCHNK